jgi:hypothetical protein
VEVVEDRKMEKLKEKRNPTGGVEEEKVKEKWMKRREEKEGANEEGGRGDNRRRVKQPKCRS